MEIKAYDRKSLPWTVKQLVGSMKKGTATYTNAVQRSLVWTNDQKSLFIHSLLINAPVPPLYATRGSEDKVYDFLDGKQRSNAIYDFLEGKYALSGIPEIEYENGTTEDINGMYFSGLSEEMQDAIKSYSLNIIYFDDLDSDQTSDIFYRLNNSSPLKAIEKMRVKCPSIKMVQRLAQHDLLKLAVSDKARTKYTDEDIVIKSFIMIKMEEPCLDLKVTKPFGEHLVLVPDDIVILNGIYDKILDIYDHMENKKSKKKVTSKTNLLTIVRFVKNNEDVEVELLANFFDGFFDADKNPTVSTEYNENVTNGSGHAASIKIRLDTLQNSFR